MAVLTIDQRVFGSIVPQVVQVNGEIDSIHPHVEFHARLRRCAQEPLPMMPGFRYGGGEVPARVEDSPRAVGKATALGIQMRERRHDDARTGTTDAIFRGYKTDVSDLVSEPGIRQRLKFENCLQIVGISHSFEELDRRKTAGDYPPARLPLDSGDGERHAQPPRCASRYCLTTNRSATWPDNILSSADRSPKTGAEFDRINHSSAAFSSGSRIWSAL